MLFVTACCCLSSRMPSRIFRSSISPFHDTLSCVCDLLFSALGFLFQLLAEPRFQNAFLYTTIRRGEKPALPSQRVCCTTELRELVAGQLPDLLCSFDACCWPCSSLPAVGHALLCLQLAMLFLRRLFGSACACHPRLLPVVTQRLCCSSPSSVSLGGKKKKRRARKKKPTTRKRKKTHDAREKKKTTTRERKKTTTRERKKNHDAREKKNHDAREKKNTRRAREKKHTRRARIKKTHDARE